MMSAREDGRPAGNGEQDYLKRRIHQEANAAVIACSPEATVIHVILATAYARRLGEQAFSSNAGFAAAWADQNRLW